jgi:hypothetical protein
MEKQKQKHWFFYKMYGFCCFFFKLRHVFQLDHWPKPSKVRGGNKFPVLPLALKPRLKRNLRKYGVSGFNSVSSVPLPMPLSYQNRSCQTLKIYRRKWSIKKNTIHAACRARWSAITMRASFVFVLF